MKRVYEADMTAVQDQGGRLSLGSVDIVSKNQSLLGMIARSIKAGESVIVGAGQPAPPLKESIMKKRINESTSKAAEYQGLADGQNGRWSCTLDKDDPDYNSYLEGFLKGVRESFGSGMVDEIEPAIDVDDDAVFPISGTMDAEGAREFGKAFDDEMDGMDSSDSLQDGPISIEDEIFLGELDDELSGDVTDLETMLQDEPPGDLEGGSISLNESEEKDTPPMSHRKLYTSTYAKEGGTAGKAKAATAAAYAAVEKKYGAEACKALKAYHKRNQDEVSESTKKMTKTVKEDADISRWNMQLSSLLEGKKSDELVVGVEAHGVRGMNSKPWRKTFKSQEAFEQWLDKNQDDVEVQGTREVNVNDPFKESVYEGASMKSKRRLTEGLTISTTTGNQGGPDSVNVNATDADAHQLMKILRLSGLNGGFAGDMQGAEASCGCEGSMADSGMADEDDVVDGYRSVESMPMPRGMMMSVQDHPEEESMSLQPDYAVEFDDVISAFDGGELFESSGPSGSGMMSKAASDKKSDPNQPTDQSAIMKSLKPSKPDTNSSLESLQKKHDAGPADAKAKKEAKTEKASGDDDASLSESLANDLYKLYAISEDASTDVTNGYKKVDTMAMPRGMGMSVQAEDEPAEIIEPTDLEDVLNALDQGAPEPVKFPKLEKLMKKHMPDVEDPKIMPKSEESETSKITGPIDDMSSGSSKSFGSDSENVFDSEDDEGDDDKEVVEGMERCDECGGLMEDDHECDKEQLEEWANTRGKSSNDESVTVKDHQFMTDTLSGGLNRIKGDQTTLPHTRVKVSESVELASILRLSGLK